MTADKFTKHDGVDLKEHLEDKIESLRCHFNIRLASSEKALEVAKNEMDRRLDVMNHLQARMDGLGKTFSTKDQYESLDERIKKLEISRAELSGKANQRAVNWAYVIAGIGIIIGIIGILI